MKNFFIFLLVLTLLIGIVNAQEEPKYNFGTMQADKELNIAPGETAITKLYFYNVYGNRITHITLEAVKVPENWDISIEPVLHEITVDVSGIPTTVEENLDVKPSEAVDEIPSTIPEGIEYISSPVGYIGADPVKVKITIPKNEKIGKIGEVRIDALASWLGQDGMVTLTQGRSFDYKISVVSEEFYEKPITEEEKIEEKETKPRIAEQITGAVVQETPKPNTMIGILISVIIVLTGIIAVLMFTKKKQ